MKKTLGIAVGLVLTIATVERAQAGSAAWNVDGSANWSVDGNWNPATGYPTGTSDDATLGSKITSDATITLTQDIALNSLTFNDNNQYTLSGAQTLTLGNTAATIVHDNTGNAVIAADLTFSTANHALSGSSTATQTWSGVVSYASGYFTKYTPDTLVLAGTSANLFTAASFTIAGGKVVLNKPAGVQALGGSIKAGYSLPGVLKWNAANQVADNAALEVSSTGLVDMNGFSDVIGTLKMSGGTVETGGGVLSISGVASGIGGVINGKLYLRTDAGLGALDATSGNTLTINADMSGLCARMQAAAGGTVRLNGSNTMNGIDHYSGTLALGNDYAVGTNEFRFYNGSAGIIQVVVAAGGARVITNRVRMTTGGNPLFGGTNALTFTGSLLIDVDMIVSVTNTAPVTFSGNVGSASGTRALTKTGPGTLELDGASINYSGNTIVSNGTLELNGILTSTTGTVSIASGASLCGTGTIRRATTVENGGTLAPARTNTVGTLTISSNLVLNASSVLAFNLGTSSDLVSVGKNLTLDGTLNVSDSGGLDAGTYRLFNYTGSLINNTLDIGSIPSNFSRYTFTIQTSVANQVNLIVKSPVQGTMLFVQ